MNSFLKSLLHSMGSFLALIAPLAIPFIQNNPKLQDSVAAILIVGINWAISHFIPTNTGASAQQNATF